MKKEETEKKDKKEKKKRKKRKIRKFFMKLKIMKFTVNKPVTIMITITEKCNFGKIKNFTL